MEKKSPLVSVIVPVYNVEKYIKRCVDSLINQSLKDIEIILIDDGSPDNCPSICDEYSQADSRVKVLHIANSGLGIARNYGLDLASGEYIAFVDSDDYVDIDAYKKLYFSAREYNADCVYAGFEVEYGRNKWRKILEVTKDTFYTDKHVYNYMLDMIACPPHCKQERKHSMSVWHSIYKRSIIYEHKIRFISERLVVSEDLPFQVDFLINCKNILLIPYTMYYHCLNDGSLTQTFIKEKFERFAYLRTVLNDKLGSSVEVKNRTNRFFIGYSRSYCINLVKTKREGKQSIISYMINHPVWNELKIEYKPSYLPINQSVIYYFTLLKWPRMLLISSYIYWIIKKIR